VTWVPRIRVKRVTPTRKVAVSTPALFPNYLFVQIELQWHRARWSPGVVRLVMSGDAPAHVPDAVITEIRSRERGGFVELPSAPGLRRGDRVRVMTGPFRDRLGLSEGQAPHERVAILLSWLGSERRIELPAGDVVALPPS